MLKVLSYTPFNEMTEEERLLYELIRLTQERHVQELKPYYDKLAQLHALKRPSLLVRGDLTNFPGPR